MRYMTANQLTTPQSFPGSYSAGLTRSPLIIGRGMRGSLDGAYDGLDVAMISILVGSVVATGAILVPEWVRQKRVDVAGAGALTLATTAVGAVLWYDYTTRQRSAAHWAELHPTTERF